MHTPLLPRTKRVFAVLDPVIPPFCVHALLMEVGSSLVIPNHTPKPHGSCPFRRWTMRTLMVS